MELGYRLAQWLELTEARNVANWAVEHLEVGGGIASFAGPTSPISHAIGVGMKGPVTESDIETLEEFYKTRGAPSNLDLCPLADPTLMEVLGRRGYRITEFNNALVRPISGPMNAPPSVRVASAEEADIWTRTMLEGFFERGELTAEEIGIGRPIFTMPGAVAVLGEMDGQPVSAAAGCLRDSLFYLFGDSTLPAFRGKGLHAQSIQARLAWGAEQGATFAAACTIPGSGSQRNYEKAGFSVAYTKMNMCRNL